MLHMPVLISTAVDLSYDHHGAGVLIRTERVEHALVCEEHTWLPNNNDALQDCNIMHVLHVLA
jgi:hypothetical protein